MNEVDFGRGQTSASTPASLTQQGPEAITNRGESSGRICSITAAQRHQQWQNKKSAETAMSAWTFPPTILQLTVGWQRGLLQLEDFDLFRCEGLLAGEERSIAHLAVVGLIRCHDVD